MVTIKVIHIILLIITSALVALCLILITGQEYASIVVNDDLYILETGTGELYRLADNKTMVEIEYEEVLDFSDGVDTSSINSILRRLEEISNYNSYDTTEVVQIGVGQGILETRWINGITYYRIQLNNLDSRIIELRGELSASQRHIKLSVLDMYGFNLHKSSISLDNFTGRVNSDGKIVSLTYNGSTEMDYDLYKSLHNWSLGWDFEL